MSALGQKRTLHKVCVMSALPPKADIGTQSRDVRFVPKADIAPTYLITSSAWGGYRSELLTWACPHSNGRAPRWQEDPAATVQSN